MAEEFEESEILFDECDEVRESCDLPLDSPELGKNNRGGKRRRFVKCDNKRSSSAPVSIPARNSTWFRQVESDLDGGDGEMVPPHVIIGRRVAEKIMAFSLCTGNGRTLKGRDLSEFRNTILRLTGFLET